ncbi:MAG: transposase [Candidatus Aminicenantes bacterium]|nr:transposase [Candidatus Aminicenantes bacterium]
MDYLEFIVRVTLHIPDKGQVMVRYYGLCKALHKP